MNELELFNDVYNDTLDYVDNSLILRLSQWGFNTFKLLEENKLSLGTIDTNDNGNFIYAVSTAFIVGKFGEFAFGDYFPDENEFNLDLLGLHFDDLRGYLNDYPNLKQKDLDKFYRGYIDLQDIWGTIFEYNKETYKSLVKIHKESGVKEPDYFIFNELIRLFDEKDEETGEIIPRNISFDSELHAYMYVTNGFQY